MYSADRLYNNLSKKILNEIKNKKANYWKKIQEKESIKLFHEVAGGVPAYKDFLKKAHINHKAIKTWQDFQLLPPVNKKNYLRKYSLEDLAWGGNLKKPLVFTATSGTTGDPVYFMRWQKLEWEYSIIIERFLKMREPANKGPVLAIVSFGMGVWIAGTVTYRALEMVGERGYPLSVITPGINKKEIFSALRLLAPHYKQTIIIGYPPFVKDTLDEAVASGIDLKKLNLRVFFAAEAIHEKFRDYIAQKGHLKNIYLDTMSIYGSADIAAMANETTTGILIRRLAEKNKRLFNDIFSPIEKAPTLAQYNPYFINFEAPGGEIMLTGDSELPLIRYSIGDNGGTFTYDEIQKKMKDYNFDLRKEAKKLKIDQWINELPFVYVYERFDLSATLYGLCIYPEWIKDALLEYPVSAHVTGKFTLITRYDEKQNQYLEINIELRKQKEENAKLAETLQKKIHKHLLSNSSEYRELSKNLNSRVIPKLKFWPAEDLLYFRPGIKQKWVQKVAAPNR